jgi:SAM-dependent methyltransferase
MKMDIGYWDSVAPQWTDQIFNTLRHDRNRVILTELERAARSASTIADFGCGIGTYLPALARLFDEVTGFDHSKACVDLARHRMRRKRDVSVHHAAAAPKSRQGLFDAVLCVNAAIAPKRSAWHGVLRSAISLLKPQGRLILVVPSAESATLIAKAERPAPEQLDDDAMETGSAPDRDGIVSIEGIPTKHFTRNDLSDTLTGLGLQVNRIRRVEYSWRSQAVTPPPELRRTLPWDWIAVARNVRYAANPKAA